MRAKVLFVDDERNVLEGLSQLLRRSDYAVATATGPEQALALLQREPADIVVTDHRMPTMTGLELLGLVRDRFPHAIRIILTGHAETHVAIRAINEGEIYRFLLKPCAQAELLVTLHLACEKLELERENRQLLSIVRAHPELLERYERERAQAEQERS